MAPPSGIAWPEYQEQIAAWIRDGRSHEEVLEALEAATGIRVTRRTLARRLADWSVRSNYSYQDKDTMRAIDQKIRYMFHFWRLTDEKMVEVLAQDGYSINLYALRDRRKQLGLFKQWSSDAAMEYTAALDELIRKEFDEGHIEDYGRRHLYTHLRSKYNIVGRQVLYTRCSSEGVLGLLVVFVETVYFELHTTSTLSPSIAVIGLLKYEEALL